MLNHVLDYARREVKDSEIGFARKEIRWQFELDACGHVSGVIPLQDKSSKHRLQTRCPDMPNMRAGGDAKRAQFLVDTAGAALMYDVAIKPSYVTEDVTTLRRNSFFKALIANCAVTHFKLEPLKLLLQNDALLASARIEAARSGIKPEDNIKFRCNGYDPLQEGSAEFDWWRDWLEKDRLSSVKVGIARQRRKPLYIDLLTGDFTEGVKTHFSLRGLASPLVAMDKRAFESYGLLSGFNAAMDQRTTRLYADGLSKLLETAENVAGAKTAYWYKHSLNDGTFDPVYTLLKSEKGGALAEARRVLQSVRVGQRSDPLENHFFAVTLTGLKGRVMIRDWMEGSFTELVSNTLKWFEDLEIVNVSGSKSASEAKLETVVTCLLREKLPGQKYGDWVKPVGSARRDLWHCALNADLPIPASAFRRLAVQLPSYMASKTVTDILFPKRDVKPDTGSGLPTARLHTRMGIIKAYFIRKPGGRLNMQPTFFPDHPEPAYHCGALLALLASIQRAALGEVGAGVVQRYYPAFSQMPGLTLGRLCANARNHLGKLDGGLAFWYEGHIAETMIRIGERAPRTLGLEGQGLFALGYYQQLATLRVRKDTDANDKSIQGE